MKHARGLALGRTMLVPAFPLTAFEISPQGVAAAAGPALAPWGAGDLSLGDLDVARAGAI